MQLHMKVYFFMYLYRLFSFFICDCTNGKGEAKGNPTDAVRGRRLRKKRASCSGLSAYIPLIVSCQHRLA